MCKLCKSVIGSEARNLLTDSTYIAIPDTTLTSMLDTLSIKTDFFSSQSFHEFIVNASIYVGLLANNIAIRSEKDQKRDSTLGMKVVKKEFEVFLGLIEHYKDPILKDLLITNFMNQLLKAGKEPINIVDDGVYNQIGNSVIRERFRASVKATTNKR